ncbi:unnamed protein product [Leuciscus chuanchicus]
MRRTQNVFYSSVQRGRRKRPNMFPAKHLSCLKLAPNTYQEPLTEHQRWALVKYPVLNFTRGGIQFRSGFSPRGWACVRVKERGREMERKPKEGQREKRGDRRLVLHPQCQNKGEIRDKREGRVRRGQFRYGAADTDK